MSLLFCTYEAMRAQMDTPESKRGVCVCVYPVGWLAGVQLETLSR